MESCEGPMIGGNLVVSDIQETVTGSMVVQLRAQRSSMVLVVKRGDEDADPIELGEEFTFTLCRAHQ